MTVEGEQKPAEEVTCLNCNTLDMCHVRHTSETAKGIILKNIISVNPTAGFAEELLELFHSKFEWINTAMAKRCIHYKGERTGG